MRWYAAVAILCLATPGAWARTYLTKSQALDLAFPDADQVEARSLFLTKEQASRVEARSGASLDGRLSTLYVGKRRGETVGYAVIEAATVRTLPQTLLVVLEPDGAVRLVRVLAFFEPEEYRPPLRWLDQFRGRRLSSGLRLGGEIQGITGATLSAQAVTRQVRKAAALCELLLESRP
ncbi:MAG: FMN-binding protein [Deltaproteobacteria bacterium]|nr:FMN-binding protein [Deltaproteobacteria bacterium]